MSAHEVDSGPAAKRSLSNAGTGLSNAAASFIAANCSPFSPPAEFLTGPPKVPDPRHNEDSCTGFLWETFQIPVTSTGNQLVMVNANPMAPMPVAWAIENPNLAFPSGEVGLHWANRYEVAGLGDLFAKIKNLADNSSRHRIVGCGLKVWATKDADVNGRGIMEGGQFKVGRTSFKGAESYITVLGTAVDWKATGVWGAAFNNPSYPILERAINSAKLQRMGMVQADEGCTVRWTDTDDFEYIDSQNYNLIGPSKTYYTNGFMPFEPTHDFASNLSNTGVTGRVQCMTYTSSTDVGYGIGQTGYYVPWGFTFPDTSGTEIQRGEPQEASKGTSRLGAFRRAGLNQTGPGSRSTAAGVALTNGIQWLAQDQGQFPELVAYNEGLPWTDNTKNFTNNLYVDCVGLEPNTVLTCQVVWHVEYIPVFHSICVGTPSPVDMTFDSLSALARDDSSFPVVVKGHSFFKSLRQGLRSAAEGASRLLGKASNLAGLVPLAQTQGISNVLGVGASFAGGIAGLF